MMRDVARDLRRGSGGTVDLAKYVEFRHFDNEFSVVVWMGFTVEEAESLRLVPFTTSTTEGQVSSLNDRSSTRAPIASTAAESLD